MRMESHNLDETHTVFIVRAMELDDKEMCSQMGWTAPAGYTCSVKQHRLTFL